ncbi:MAG: pyruvate, phosphate dikinase [Acidobacteriota bacterium]|nr:pyruvate, phosphate dikinase [Acidobacteriota bacterium]
MVAAVEQQSAQPAPAALVGNRGADDAATDDDQVPIRHRASIARRPGKLRPTLNKAWYPFAPGSAAGGREMADLLGGKGANLAEMCRLGFPVPPGFTLPTALCRRFLAAGQLDTLSIEAIAAGIEHIEATRDAARSGESEGPRFGDSERPLLVSVRSGARVSMPGMMDTVLNLGLNRDTLEGLAVRSSSRRFALDSYRRLIQMFGDVVRGVDRALLEAPLTRHKREAGVDSDHELDVDRLEALIDELEALFERHAGDAFPQQPIEQLRQAVAAVFGSWNGRRAVTYRALQGISDAEGTAATVQAMVFGNLGGGSGTGVAFSRNPATGSRTPMGEWLLNAQGEDVVAGVRTPTPLSGDPDAPGGAESLETVMPEVHRQLIETLDRLEGHFGDLQDVEFTVEEGRLWLLQTRSGKRTATAALRIAVDLVQEGLCDRETAVLRVSPEQAGQLMHPQVDPSRPGRVLARGLPASPGAVSGAIVLDAAEAERRGRDGEDVILVRSETSPEDIHGMYASRGVLTRTGGMTSHAAVVARGMGRACVVGCDALTVDESGRCLRFDGADGPVELAAGDEISLDGTQGDVFAGLIATVSATVGGRFAQLMSWADDIRELGVRANADTPGDAIRAVELGAEGIGLCRTEHMFFGRRRTLAVREMILAEEPDERRRALDRIEPMQRQDFLGIFRALGGRPMNVRLLDPPLHEFLPTEASEIAAIAEELGVKPRDIQRKAEMIREQNPMLGHRGCRLGLSFPEIYEVQVSALFSAACDVLDAQGAVAPEVMVPLVMEPAELESTRDLILGVARRVQRSRGHEFPIVIGTMIELPRAALLAGSIANHADFFSFGTNDLTQTTMGLSRDDSGRFLPGYIEAGILERDPFQSIDVRGVGRLVELATREGRVSRPDLKIGVCGEHGGDSDSIRFFDSVGVDYVSCSPFRVPVARLAAAHAVLARR